MYCCSCGERKDLFWHRCFFEVISGVLRYSLWELAIADVVVSAAAVVGMSWM